MEPEQKRTLIRILITAILFGAALIVPVPEWTRLFVFLLPYLIFLQPF